MTDSIPQYDLAVQNLESQWESGVIPDLDEAIPLDARQDTELLTDLACIDLQNRLQYQIETRVEAYTTAFPELAADDLAVLELIRTEYSCRTDGHSLDASSYRQRFPHLAHQIEMMFQLEFSGAESPPPPIPPTQWRCAHCDRPILRRSGEVSRCDHCGQPVCIGRHELQQRIGQGAFGYVYKAFDPKLDRTVAVKIPRASQFLTPEEAERFLRESRHAAQLDHPGIVRIFDTGRHHEVPYIVSEYVDGRPLSTVIEERSFGFRETAVLMVEICQAVQHAHQRGVIHRDLKPSNIMVSHDTPPLHPRVMDFGLARRRQTDVTVTLEGQTVGTPAYMSPEQARGELSDVGPRSDIYSLGVIMYQLLCGVVPFRGNAQKLIQQVIEDDPPSPSRYRNRIPRDLETICLKTINREPTDRYPSVTAFIEELQRWLDGKPIHARPLGLAGKTLRWCRRRPTVATLLATLALTILAGTAGITWQWREAEAARMASEADLSDALESVDRVLGHLGSDTLEDIPQAKQLRAQVLDDALEFFTRFAKRKPDDPRVAMQVANAHRQIARIQNALGNRQEAGEAYRAAIDGYENLGNRAPNRRELQENAASAYSGYAHFLLVGKQRKLAEQQQRKCLALYENLRKENPESGKLESKLAASRADLGRMLTGENEVRLQYEQAIEKLEQLVKTREAIGYRRDLARVLNNYAIQLVRFGQNGDAERHRERAIVLLEQVIEDDPEDETKLSLYANCCLKLVESLRQESRVDDAMRYQEKAVAAYRQLTEDYPATPRHRERFASALRETGDLADVQHRSQDALVAYEDAVRQRETLVALFPSNRGYQRNLVVDLGKLTDQLVDLDRKSDAEIRLREQVELLRGLAETGEDEDRIRLLQSLRELASTIKDSKNPDQRREAEALQAEVDAQIADYNVEEILKSDTTAESKLLLLTLRIAIARDQGDLQTVEAGYRGRVDIYRNGVEENPENMRRRKGLAREWTKLGEAMLSQARTEEAAEAYRQAVEIDQQLLIEDPDSATYTTQLINHGSKLGHLLEVTGQVDDSIDVLQRILALTKKLHEERRNEGFRQVRVALAYLQLGAAHAAKGNLEQSLTAYEQSYELAEVVGKQPGLERFKSHILNHFAWALLCCPDESLRDPSRALELALQAVELTPENGNYLSTLALANYELDQWAAAIEKFEESSRLDESLAPLNTLLMAMAQAKSGSFESAQQSYQQSIKLHEKNPVEAELFEQYRLEAEALLQGKE